MKKYLTRALRYYKGNAAGTTKFAALWLAAQVNPEGIKPMNPEGIKGTQHPRRL